MKTTFTLQNRVNIAKEMTVMSASMKDWRIRNKHNKAMREVAREWMNGKGYFIGSVIELKNKYGDLCHYETNAPGADKKCVWAVDYNDVNKRLEFVGI